jgi:hypothetical protein
MKLYALAETVLDRQDLDGALDGTGDPEHVYGALVFRGRYAVTATTDDGGTVESLRLDDVELEMTDELNGEVRTIRLEPAEWRLVSDRLTVLRDRGIL